MLNAKVMERYLFGDNVVKVPGARGEDLGTAAAPCRSGRAASAP